MSKSSYPVGYGRPPERIRFRGAAAEERDEAAEASEEEDRFVFEDEHAQMFGDRYDEFKERFERAVNAVDIDALCDLAADFADAKSSLVQGKKQGR